MSDRIAFIGDIHGERTALESLLALVLPRTPRLVFLGDYVNRGPDARGVLECLKQLQEDPTVDASFLGGNHDRVFLDLLHGRDRDNEFLRMGGGATVRSYVRPPFEGALDQLRAAVPPSHLRFLEELAPAWSEEGIFASHRLLAAHEVADGTFRIGGHSVQVSLKPEVTEHFATIDTGCGTVRDGRLTAFYWPSRTWDQVSA